MKLEIITPSRYNVDTTEISIGLEGVVSRTMRRIPVFGRFVPEPKQYVAVPGLMTVSNAVALIRNKEEFKYVGDSIRNVIAGNHPERTELDYVVHHPDGSITTIRHFGCFPIEIRDMLAVLSVDHIVVTTTPAP